MDFFYTERDKILAKTIAMLYGHPYVIKTLKREAKIRAEKNNPYPPYWKCRLSETKQWQKYQERQLEKMRVIVKKRKRSITSEEWFIRKAESYQRMLATNRSLWKIRKHLRAEKLKGELK